MNPIAVAALERARARQGVRPEKAGEEERGGPGPATSTLAGQPFPARERHLPPPDEATRVDLVLRIEGRREALGDC